MYSQKPEKFSTAHNIKFLFYYSPFFYHTKNGQKWYFKHICVHGHCAINRATIVKLKEMVLKETNIEKCARRSSQFCYYRIKKINKQNARFFLLFIRQG